MRTDTKDSLALPRLSRALTAAALLALTLALSPYARGQTDEPAEAGAAQAAAPLPACGALAPLWQTALTGKAPWRPDWPQTLPPDAFQAEEAAAITVIWQGRTLYLCREGPLLSAFPFQGWGEAGEEGVLWQAEAALSGPAERRRPVLLTLRREQSETAAPAGAGSEEEANRSAGATVEAEFLAFDSEERPALARVSVDQGASYFFVTFNHLQREVLETWHDADGAVQRVYTLRYKEGAAFLPATLEAQDADGAQTLTFQYDSAGNTTEIASPAGVFSALYATPGRPRYWRRQPSGAEPEWFYLQWEGALPLRLSGEAAGAEIDLRYEYTLDTSGNWTERQEAAFSEQYGVMIARKGETIQRRLTYE